MSNQRKEGSAWALLPLGVFLVLFIGSGIISGDFYKMPTLVAFIISTAVAFLFNRKVDFNTKLEDAHASSNFIGLQQRINPRFYRGK